MLAPIQGRSTIRATEGNLDQYYSDLAYQAMSESLALCQACILLMPDLKGPGSLSCCSAILLFSGCTVINGGTTGNI